jgi:hypothetical protein
MRSPARGFPEILVTLLLWAAALAPHAAEAAAGERDRPKLVAVIIVDGLPQEQVLKYRDQLGAGGIRRLLRQGAWFANAHYGHAMTDTAAGHATIVTGAYPYRHGIVGNELFDRRTRSEVYAVSDPQRAILDEPTPAGAGTSPRFLRVPTLGDELRLETDFRSRVLSVSLKDRAAILAGGKLGTAYWFSAATGRFVTSSYYRTNYPDWWQRFHTGHPQEAWAGKAWVPLLPRAAYARSAPEDRPAHADPGGFGTKFPFVLNGDLAKPGRAYYEALTATPFGDEYLLAFAKAAVQGERLGKNPAGVPDLLAVSFSTHDYVNHAFGPESMQSHDHLLRLDRVLADLFGFLDREVGPGNALIVLTADHGFTPLPGYCSDVLRLEAGWIDTPRMLDAVNAYLARKFGPGRYAVWWVGSALGLDDEAIEARGLSRGEVESAAAAFLAAQDGVFQVFTRTQLALGQVPPTRLARQVVHSWSPDRSADLYVVPQPCWQLGGGGSHLGTSHGSPWPSDTHVPLMAMGPRWIRPGRHEQAVEVVDLAPTLASLLGLRPPDGSEGRILYELFRRAPPAPR